MGNFSEWVAEWLLLQILGSFAYLVRGMVTEVENLRKCLFETHSRPWRWRLVVQTIIDPLYHHGRSHNSNLRQQLATSSLGSKQNIRTKSLTFTSFSCPSFERIWIRPCDIYLYVAQPDFECLKPKPWKRYKISFLRVRLGGRILWFMWSLRNRSGYKRQSERRTRWKSSRKRELTWR